MSNVFSFRNSITNKVIAVITAPTIDDAWIGLKNRVDNGHLDMKILSHIKRLANDDRLSVTDQSMGSLLSEIDADNRQGNKMTTVWCKQ